jgi:hypothetical protein
MGQTTEGSEFESWKDQEFLLLEVLQTGSVVHRTSYSVGIGGSFPGGKADAKKTWIYIHSAIRLHGVSLIN